MTDELDTGSLLARTLSELWTLHKSDAFLAYLSQTFQHDFTVLPRFDALFIAECEEGDARAGLPSIFTRVWKMDDNGLTRASAKTISFAAADGFDRTPIIRFQIAADRVLFGERFGPELISRKEAIIFYQDDRALLNHVRVLWTSTGP